MKYLAAHFEIACMDDMMQIARDLLMDVAGEAGFESFEDTERGVDGYVQEQLFDRQLLDDGIASFPLDGVSIVYNINKVEDQDWNAVWEEQGFEPIDIDHRVVVYDAKGEVPQHDACAVMIGIDARQAFGTGTHETTQMIIASLLDMQLEGKSVLDCGCGTGILSIAAAKCGATHCVGYDIDEWSVDNSRHNAQLNGVDMQVLLGDASVTATLNEKFDVVLANINRNILLADMPAFVGVMKEGGALILSGFYPSDAAMLCDKAASLGLTHTAQKSNGDWACLMFSK